MDPTVLSALLSASPALVIGAILTIALGYARTPAVAALWRRVPWYVQPIVLLAPCAEAVAQALLTGAPWLPPLLVAALAPIGGAVPLLVAAYTAHLPSVNADKP